MPRSRRSRSGSPGSVTTCRSSCASSSTDSRPASVSEPTPPRPLGFPGLALPGGPASLALSGHPGRLSLTPLSLSGEAQSCGVTPEPLSTVQKFSQRFGESLSLPEAMPGCPRP
ncbi:exported hypothetical protein [Nostocoides japonicum T1-X7]|uniref:Uncharacterized protein n=1 Tax=Nostocoides japonicum T1-X7 TaxID=1194083 RepID=A0A077M8X4_9MICO|nr:exported hypothetical protein [Tetrasphaera japonica T1-X7]